MKSLIGTLAIDAYKADQERRKAKKEFNKSFSNNICDGHARPYNEDRGSACWINLPEEEFCDACKITQPLHKIFIAASKRSRGLKLKLANQIKAHLRMEAL